MERLTRSAVEDAVKRVNVKLSVKNVHCQVKLSHCYDHYIVEQVSSINSVIREHTIFTGSLRECFIFLKGMSRAEDILLG